MIRVALATCAEFPQLEHKSEALALEALRDRDVHVEPVVWNDDSAHWSRFDLVVIRSTWDYAARRDAFLDWAESVPRLANPASVVRWNTDKRYLVELAAAGLPVTPTALIEPGDDVVLPAVGDFVIKPAVSAGARGAGRFDAAFDQQRKLALTHATDLLDAGKSVIVQPYLGGIDQYGETNIVYLNGEFSHAVRKSPRLVRALGDVPEPQAERIARRHPLAAECQVAEEVYAALPQLIGAEELLYARIDLAPGLDGLPQVMEVELAEPALFFGTDGGAAGRFANAVLEYLGVASPPRAIGRVPAPRTVDAVSVPAS